LSVKNINDSELAMIFVVCHPCNPPEAQIGLALNILCGFSPEEIANAFLTDKEVIYKRLQRARKKLRTENIKVQQPAIDEINKRLQAVLMTLYLFYNEGYYSLSEDVSIREDLCFEAMRLTYLLVENNQTNNPSVNALLALMCFQSSRFNARHDQNGQIILYQDQDTTLWNRELITNGEYFLSQASQGSSATKFHLEAGIAYWHTKKADTKEKWENILQLYNQLLLLEYSPMAALNRTYALSKANSKTEAIIEAERIGLEDNYLYHTLLGELYSNVNNEKAISHLQKALKLAKSTAEKTHIANKISKYFMVK
jgi:predicted RNA polymerase sigma factor